MDNQQALQALSDWVSAGNAKETSWASTNARICGRRGTGKTTLARELVQLCGAQLHGGVFWMKDEDTYEEGDLISKAKEGQTNYAEYVNGMQQVLMSCTNLPKDCCKLVGQLAASTYHTLIVLEDTISCKRGFPAFYRQQHFRGRLRGVAVLWITQFCGAPNRELRGALELRTTIYCYSSRCGHHYSLWCQECNRSAHRGGGCSGFL
jgi:hypothetical protein